jgi:hypothetical protein
MDPDRIGYPDFTLRWQYRLVAFAIAFSAEVRKAGLDIDNLWERSR